MITKSLIVAAAVAASLTALAPVQQAEAKVKLNLDANIYLGGGGFYPGYGPGYYPVYDEPDYYGGISCHKGKKIVKWSGFYNVNPFDCSAPVYQYKAWKFGNPYKVKVNMSGDIIKVKPWF